MRKIYWSMQYLIWISILILTGCAGAKMGSRMIPKTGATIAEIYRKQTINSPIVCSHLPHAEDIKMQNYYTNNSEQDLDNNFKLVSNPLIKMYVYPHLASKEALPVPGYVTKFHLYEKNYWALPGEAVQ